MKTADYKLISYLRIHPGIGISRVGNGSGYFYAPEVPYPTTAPPEPNGYKDAHGYINRQAQRFRIYGYDQGGNVIGEITAPDAEIVWTVHLANKKAAWYCFDVALDLPQAQNTQSARRNPQIQGAQRFGLAIVSGACSISGPKKRSKPLVGWFIRPDYPVELGELRTDERGRLIVLGGKGKSGTPFPGNSVGTFANNNGWHDDTSDGPVTATVKLPGRRRGLNADPAWVVVAPPNYAPDIVTVQTMYDVMYDTLAGWRTDKPERLSFTEHILPILKQLCDAQWVNRGFLALFGWKAPNEFLRDDFIERLAALDKGHDTSHSALRREIFRLFRDPQATNEQPAQWPPLYGDAYGNFTGVPNTGLALTATRYKFLQAWADGKFIEDYDPRAKTEPPFAALPDADRPSALDRAALHFCMGGPFHPGCEMTWPMRSRCMYRDMFRIRPRGVPEPDYGEFLTAAAAKAEGGPLAGSGPGDVTRWMAVPWQTDTASCLSGYDNPPDPYLPSFWPARVPNDVLDEASYKIIVSRTSTDDQRIQAFNTRTKFLRSLHLDGPYFEQLKRMLRFFGQLGVIERKEQHTTKSLPEILYVEQEMIAPIPPGAPQLSESPGNGEYKSARFGRKRTPTPHA